MLLISLELYLWVTKSDSLINALTFLIKGKTNQTLADSHSNLPVTQVFLFGNEMPLSSSSEALRMEPYILLSLFFPSRGGFLSLKLSESGQVLMVNMLSDADQGSK